MKARVLKACSICLVWLGVLWLGHSLGETLQNLKPVDVDLISRIFGESRTVISSRLYQAADRYYHGGLSRVDCAHLMDGGDHESEDEQQTHDHGENHSDGPCSVCSGQGESPGAIMEAEQKSGKQTHYTGPWWYRKLLLSVRPTGHVHVSTKSEVAELLPWFRIATKVDPHNVAAYEVGAFWLARQMHETAKGLEFLEEGIRNNPDAFELELTRGQILLNEKRLEEADLALRLAEKKWRAARKLFEADKLPENLTKPEPLLLASVLVFRAEVMKEAGNLGKALALFKRAYPFAPDQHSLKERMAELERALKNEALKNPPPQDEFR